VKLIVIKILTPLKILTQRQKNYETCSTAVQKKHQSMQQVHFSVISGVQYSFASGACFHADCVSGPEVLFQDLRRDEIGG